ncbi:MAG: hypothetical protein AAFV80_14065, partial [Bacteroidota bacterium]
MVKKKQKVSKSKSWWRILLQAPNRWFLLGLLFLTALAYWPSLQNGFTNWDDEVYVVKNTMMTDPPGAALARIFSEPVSANYH